VDDQALRGQEAWIVDYVDGQGERHIKTFARKGDAGAEHAKVAVDVSKGIHTPESRSLTVAKAAEQWLQAAELEGLERSTLDHYRTHVIRHRRPLRDCAPANCAACVGPTSI
jgi:hypothetical protein